MEGAVNALFYVILAWFLVGLPCRRVLRRMGFSPYLAALVLIPWLGYIILEALVAFAKWPRGHAAPVNVKEMP